MRISKNLVLHLALLLFAFLLVHTPAARADTYANCPSEPASNVPIALGKTFSGSNCSLHTAGDVDSFVFEGMTGETYQLAVGINGAAPTQICLTLYDPSAVKVISQCSNVPFSSPSVVIDQKLAVTGTYTMVITETSSATLNYGVSLKRLYPFPPDAQPIPKLAQSRAGNITPLTDSDAWTFVDATTGTYRVTATMTSTNSQLCMTVYFSDFTIAGSGCTNIPFSSPILQFDFTPTTAEGGTNMAFLQVAGNDSTATYTLEVSCLVGTCPPQPPVTTGDFDGDGKSDYAVWRPSNGTWFVIPSNTPSNFLVQQWGTAGDIPVRGDYDGDGKIDFAVWRPSSGTWFIIPSSDPTTFMLQQWGTNEDIPVPGDYDGDGKTDFAVWRPSSGTWFIIPSSNPSAPIAQQWGTQGDVPVPGDYDGDGKTDFAVFRPSTGTWFIIPTSNPSLIVQQWGTQGDIPVPGDYDGDGKTDFAVWRPSTGTWFIIPSSNPSAPIVKQWGTQGDIPVPVDYDGDKKTDIAVWRPSSGTWFIIPSSTPANFTVTQWGISTDVPVQKPIGQ